MGVFVIILIVIGVGYYHHRKKENEAAAIRRQQIEQSVRTNGDVNRMLSELRGFVRSMNQINQADNDTCVISISIKMIFMNIATISLRWQSKRPIPRLFTISLIAFLLHREIPPHSVLSRSGFQRKIGKSMKPETLPRR